MRNSERPEDETPRAEAPVEEEGGSFGAWLRRHRELREIELEDIAESSKISMAYLRAFEEERFDILPAEVFAKGFLAQYADYVGLDPQEVINFYLQARGEKEAENEEVEQAVSVRRSPGLRLGWLALLVSLALLVTFWYFSRGEGDGSAATESPVAPSSVESRPAETGLGAEEPVEARAGTETPVEEPETIRETLPEPEVPLKVVLDFFGECWVEARLDGGQQRIAELKVQGESLTLEAQEVIDLKVGNTQVVEVEVNGQPYDLGDRSGTSVRTVRIDLASLGTGLESTTTVTTSSSQESVNP